MSNFDLISKLTSPQHIYYDLVITNYYSNQDALQQIEFNETRNSNIVPRADEYYLSIVRFQVDSYSLPSFFADIEPNQPNINLMTSSITMSWYDIPTATETFGTQRYNIWVPNIQYPAPTAPNSNPFGLQQNTLYYNSYSFEHVINIFNTTLITAFNDVIGLAPGGPPNIPFFKWNSSESKVELYCDSLFFDNKNIVSGYFNIYFNRPMYALLNSLPLQFRNLISSPNGTIYKLLIYNNNFSNTQLINGISYIKVEQEYSTISNWTPVTSIVFSTNTLPVVPNQISAPQLQINGVKISTTSTSQFSNVITDIASNDMVYKPNLLYVPSAEYRLIDLQTNTPIKQLDFKVYYRDKFGNLNPMLFPVGATATMKVLFIKKSSRL